MTDHPTPYGRGWRDGSSVSGLSRAEEEDPDNADRSAYIRGFNSARSKNKDVVEGSNADTPVQELTDRIVQEVEDSRKVILDHLIEDPGFMATFGNDFTPDFVKIQMTSQMDPDNLLDVLHITVQHQIVIRKNEVKKVESEGLTIDPDEIKRLRKELVEASNRSDYTHMSEIRKQLNDLEKVLSENHLRLTEEGNIESV